MTMALPARSAGSPFLRLASLFITVQVAVAAGAISIQTKRFDKDQIATNIARSLGLRCAAAHQES